MSSIRQRTLGLALLVFGASMLMIGFISYRYAAHEVEELYDASLAQNARVLEGLIQVPLPDADRAILLNSLETALLRAEQSDKRFEGHQYESKLAFQLWEDDQLLLRSASAPEIPLGQQPAGYSTLTVDQLDWRIYVLKIPDTNKRVVVGARGCTRRIDPCRRLAYLAARPYWSAVTDVITVVVYRLGVSPAITHG